MGSGWGAGETELLAFDAALNRAGMAQFNLLKVSSIIPPGAIRADSVDLPPGSLLPAAFGSTYSSLGGQVISAAVAVGLPADPDEVGVIMEFAGPVEEKAALDKVRLMAERALVNRGTYPRDILFSSASRSVEGPTAVFAGVALLP